MNLRQTVLVGHHVLNHGSIGRAWFNSCVLLASMTSREQGWQDRQGTSTKSGPKSHQDSRPLNATISMMRRCIRLYPK